MRHLECKQRIGQRGIDSKSTTIRLTKNSHHAQGCALDLGQVWLLSAKWCWRAGMKTHNAMQPPGPRFKVGDQVIVTIPGTYRNKVAVVTEVLNHWGDYVYRYRVQFADETS